MILMKTKKTALKSKLQVNPFTTTYFVQFHNSYHEQQFQIGVPGLGTNFIKKSKLTQSVGSCGGAFNIFFRCFWEINANFEN